METKRAKFLILHEPAAFIAVNFARWAVAVRPGPRAGDDHSGPAGILAGTRAISR